ncbi:helix-turn-helix domain-containing protein [Halobiforma nitratireducens]|uniref:HTH DNA-binding protein n=1 Tax=Halobiforma nitratireducens JCM 10879 TaxID=1227454 RepID=M0LZ82_9EURY|nr:helix-turn-helix domain-containing protein [Halobiforma nitratireducens]EMA38756.1 HTH DNA-binding protein [Halobiforma nitratireducens JCM 10879]
MYEATFVVGDSSVYTEPTAGTDCRVELWCNDHSDLLYVVGSQTGPLFERISDTVGVEERVDDGGEAVVITSSCFKAYDETHIDRYLAAHNCLLVPPLRYEDGRKHCRVLALEASSLTGLYADLLEDGFEIDIHSKREIAVPSHSSPLLTLEDVVPELTARQREVLSLAVDRGYYELPRETTTEELAAGLEVGRRTVEDHLRRAERKLLPSLVSYLY